MKHIMKIILLCVSSLFLLLAFPNAGRAQVNIRIEIVPDNPTRIKTPRDRIIDARGQCARMCKGVQGSPGCRHAYLYYKAYRTNNPVCHITSDPTPKKPYTKGVLDIWSRQKGLWLNASDFGKGPVRTGNRVGGKGYYIVKMSGSGWIKGAGNTATLSKGHEYFFNFL